MARIREEFDFRGKRYSSLNNCLMNSGSNRKTIIAERTNVRKIRCESDIVIPKSAKTNEPSEYSKRMYDARVAVEEIQQRKMLERNEYYGWELD